MLSCCVSSPVSDGVDAPQRQDGIVIHLVEVPQIDARTQLGSAVDFPHYVNHVGDTHQT